jgi:hypothetical protein
MKKVPYNFMILLVQHNNLLWLHMHGKLYNNYRIIWEIERRWIKKLKAKVKRGVSLIRGIKQLKAKVKRGVAHLW